MKMKFLPLLINRCSTGGDRKEKERISAFRINDQTHNMNYYVFMHIHQISYYFYYILNCYLCHYKMLDILFYGITIFKAMQHITSFDLRFTDIFSPSFT